jgi:hypothetical protein
MKKSIVTKDLPIDIKEIVKPLKRLQLYYIQQNRKPIFFFSDELDATSRKIPAMLTHYTKYGLKFKVLVNNSGISHNGYYHIRYEILRNFKIIPMLAEDLPLFTGAANQFMSDAFKRSIAFK